MAKSMKNILEQLIRENDFLEDGLYHGYINLTSLATYLLPKIEQISGKSSTVPSITMTLSRIAKEIQGSNYVRIRPEEMRIRTGISYRSFKKGDGLAKRLYQVYNEAHSSTSPDHFFTLVEGTEEFSVVFSRDFTPAVAEIETEYQPLLDYSDLAILIIRISPRYLQQKGIIYFITKQLSFFDINIVEMHTSSYEVSLLIHDADKKKAMSILG